MDRYADRERYRNAAGIGARRCSAAAAGSQNNVQNRSCECTGGAVCTPDPEIQVFPSLAMVYVPQQVFRDLYELPVGHSRGTIFRELDKPFLAHRNGGSKR